MESKRRNATRVDGLQFWRKKQFVQLLAPPVQNLGVPDPQFLYPVISFIVSVVMQQKFSMQL